MEKIIQYSIRHKLIILLLTAGMAGFGIYALLNLPIGAVPDITNNQVQVITTSRNLATQDVEKFLTYPVELEMANLPGVKEIRSVSKFGLSVVTVVFDDDMGTYLPRQLIAEKIKLAEERIPEGFGKPFMGPVTTGLGEIYQYIIDVEPGYKEQYSITDLRTIQDWIVKRQLAGIPGVVEVNTWGGYLKQYEVSVDPERLRAMNISLSEVFDAVEANNSVAGGAYIEKNNESYFIRGEGLVETLNDIEQIVVANRDGLPILVRDLATVGFGKANRFGAITGNGEGEKVMGQIMMLKGANSKAVIEAVKERIEDIRSTLPPGVLINGFLERSELIGKTTFTVAENLTLGCLIVIFVVVLLLGNIRSGLVVASVIPICLLFAISLMYIFGVDANLMSLGAIDFGIIIDGAVIIVEFITYKINMNRSVLMNMPGTEYRRLKDEITYQGTSRMMHSAVFGQLIIIIVFIPILSLVGVEGKMFRPMALVFTFALIGAMILCFTYVPVMASLFIKPADPGKVTISQKLIKRLENAYYPAIRWTLRKKSWTLGAAIVLLVSAAFLFSRMGAEFVPTLDEGDFVIQPVLKTGTSLGKTIEISTRIEQILMEFPEVEQVVTRIGAAEVPTDPMSMEEGDVIIKLRPKSEWATAGSKDELAEKFKEALSVIPGVDYEFTQPIEMRFNELVTGVRADLAIKIFGEDLDVLYKKASEVEQAIRDVEGAADIVVEKVAGLPQMSVRYDRNKIARYGLSIRDLNDVITTGFAGKVAGTVFENEKQFDLVVRYDEAHRKDIEDIETASVLLRDGNKLPLREFAEISYTKGPAKISRDDTKRRIVVGVNVRNRDLESVVKDVQRIIEEKITLPVGYHITYGGQFENLRTASKRLMLAVPVALLLIFILLYFAFNSVREALMIFSAIPLAAIGGILLLYLRGMPFSISAGVGFIALFGIAVLNGIVLIEHFNELKKEGMNNIYRRVLTGTRQRLRPVLLTASAAALGFLPMAISTSAGAEVQRPLATVVIGGLISATALTLLVLPVLYTLFGHSRSGRRRNRKLIMGVVVGLFLFPVITRAQETISLEDAIEQARMNNRGYRASAIRVEQNEQLLGASFDPAKTQFYYSFDENNIAENGLPLKVWGVSQSLRFPTVYGAQRQVRKSKLAMSREELALDEKLLVREVSKAYYQVQYWLLVEEHYAFLDSLYDRFEAAARSRYEAGETNYLEKLTAQTKRNEVTVLLKQSRESVEESYANLRQWIQSDSTLQVEEEELPQLQLQELDTSQHPGINYYRKARELSVRSHALERQQLLPDLHFTLFQGTNNGENARNYMGFQAGISIPLWFGAQRAQIRAANAEKLILWNESENYRQRLLYKYRSLMADIRKHKEAIDYYENTGKNLARELIRNAGSAFVNGEIDYLQYAQFLENARKIELSYLESLLKYDMKVLEANYLTE